jgi:ketosteroid isomerase-like protein
VSDDDLAVIRDHYAATNERDFARVMSQYSEDVVLEVGEDLPFLINGTFTGREAVGEFFGDWFRSFDSDLRFEITTLEPLGDGSILVVADYFVRGRASGIELKAEVVWTYRLRDGKIVRIVGHDSPEAARNVGPSSR